MEGPKDQGINVREKAKQLVALLKDDERLKNERARALKAKERSVQSMRGFGSDGADTISPGSGDVSASKYIFYFISFKFWNKTKFFYYIFLI